MAHFKHRPNKIISTVIADLFFYLSFVILIALLVTYLYWQLEDNKLTYEYYEDSITIEGADKSFSTSVRFCNSNTDEFTVSRYYYDILNNTYYPVPDGVYRIDKGPCFSAQFIGYTGNLKPGEYEYHVIISYRLNPIRTYSEKVAKLNITVI